MLVTWANLTFSEENCSSISNNSKFGAGNYYNDGGKSAAFNNGIGVSSEGLIKVTCSCFNFNSSMRAEDYGTKFMSNLYKLSSKIPRKFLGNSYGSSKQDLNFSDIDAMFGTKCIYGISNYSGTYSSRSISWVNNHENITEMILKLSYLSIYWSLNIFVEPATINLPFLFLVLNAATKGLFLG